MGDEREGINMTTQKIAVGLVAVALLSSSLSILAQPRFSVPPPPTQSFVQRPDKDLVRVFNVIPTVDRTYSSPHKIDEVAFSIHNRADDPLEWVKIRIIVRNTAKEAIHSEAKEINFVKYMGKPLAPGAIMQISQLLFIRGYGSVEVRLIDFRLSLKGSKLTD